MNQFQISEWGTFALVSYIPDPLRSFLCGLRQALSGKNNAQPHVTILPPRPLKLPVQAASRQAREVLRQFAAFHIELSRVCHFPGTNFLYLDLSEGVSLLHEIHDALNAGDLDDGEELEFRPHLTLAGPVSPEKLETLLKEAELSWHSVPHPRRFKVQEIVGLWLSPDAGQGEWRRIWSQRLRGYRASEASPHNSVTTQTS